MRVFCPTCQEPVTIGDDLAGKATNCPLCKAAFTAPTLFSSPAPPSSPSSAGGYAALPPPPTPSSPTAPAFRSAETVTSTPAAPAPTPAPPPPPPPREGYSQTFGCSLTPEIVQWIAPGALVLTLLLTFFSWNGAYPGGHGVYTQSLWGAFWGGFSTDTVGDKVLQLDSEKPGEDVKPLARLVRSNEMMFFYIVLLLITTVLAVLFTIYPLVNFKPPPSLEPLLPWRNAAIAGASLLLVLMLSYQCLRGFGLENGLEDRAHAEVKERLPEKPTAEERAKFEVALGAAEGRYNIRRTCVFTTVWWLNLLAAAGAGAAYAMSRQTGKPAPRVEVMW